MWCAERGIACKDDCIGPVEVTVFQVGGYDGINPDGSYKSSPTIKTMCPLELEEALQITDRDEVIDLVDIVAPRRIPLLPERSITIDIIGVN